MKNILFDFDGTLIDSKKGILLSLKKAFQDNKLDHIYSLKEKAISSMIGPRIEVIINQIIPPDIDSKSDLLVASFRKYYDNGDYKEISVYEGVKEFLGYCYKQNIDIYIVTNKPKNAVSKILEELYYTDFFKDVVTSDYFSDRIITKSEMVEYLVDKHSLNKALTMIVGDQKSDMDAGEENGIMSIFATYGYGSYNEAQFSIDNLAELKNYLKRK